MAREIINRLKMKNHILTGVVIVLVVLLILTNI